MKKLLFFIGLLVLWSTSMPVTAAADEPNVQPAAFEDYAVILHLTATDWGSVPYIHAWYTENNQDIPLAGTGWPGEKMTAIDGHPGYYGWINNSGIMPEKLIFHNNNGKQTADLAWMKDHLVWEIESGTTAHTVVPSVFKNYASILHLTRSDWGDPYAFVWGTKTISDTWAGDKMEAIEGYPGYYGWKKDLTSTPTNIIFNNNGGKQTVDLGWNGSRQIWEITNSTSTNQEGKYEASYGEYVPESITYEGTVVDPDPEDPDPDPFVIPDAFKKYSTVLHLEGLNWSNPYIFVWNGNDKPAGEWHGTEMTPIEGYEGFYGWINQTTVKPANLIFNDGDNAQTGNLTWTEGKVWCLKSTSDISDHGTYTPELDPIVDPDPDPDPTPDPDEAFKQYNVVLHLDGPNWTTPYIYVWKNENDKNTDLAGTWPGTEMKPITDKPGYYGWTNLTGEEPTNLIFNNNGGSQTDNLTWTNGKVWRLDGYMSIYEEATYEPQIQSGTSHVGKYLSCDGIQNGVRINSTNGITELTLFGDGVVKVFQTHETNPVERKSVTVCGTPNGSFEIDGESIDSDVLTFTTDQLRVVVKKEDTGLTFYTVDKNGQMNQVLSQSNNWNIVGDVYQAFDAPGTKAFYGAGYVADANVAGKTIRMNNTQTGGWPDAHDYHHNISTPFVTSPKGFGVLFDDHYLDSQMTPDQYKLSYKSASKNPVSYYFIAGGDMENVLANYADLTGHQPLPPFWSMGYITSRFGYESRGECEDVIMKMRDAGVPLDGIVLDIYWQGPAKEGMPAQAMGGLKWDTDQFPNPNEMVKNFLNGFEKDNKQVKGGVNTILITEPYFSYQGGIENVKEMRTNKYVFAEDCPNMGWIGGGALIDVTIPNALDWLNQKVYTNEEFSDITGWWLDLGEPEHFLDNADNAYKKHANDDTHAQVHNEYGLRWLEGTYNGLVQKYPERRHLLMPRSGTTGMQRYASFPWTGDISRSWNGLAVQIPALLSSGMSGVAYLGSDIGGFQNPEGQHGNIPEMYLRWVQFGVFSPVLRTHTDIKWHPSNVAEPYEAAYDAVRDDVRKAIRMRYENLPYSYTLSYENSLKGTPLARPMAYYDPENDALLSCNDQYYWGKDILVAPVITYTGSYNWGNSATSRNITFPEAGEKWVDLNDDRNFEIYQGGAVVNYNAPLSNIPHFARYNSIIPTYDASTCTSTSDIDLDNIIMTAYTMGNKDDFAYGYMYDDDHQSASALSSGNFTLLEVEVDAQAEDYAEIRVSTPSAGYSALRAPQREAAQSRSLTVKLPMYTKDLPEKIKSQNEGTDVTRLTDKSAFDAAVAESGKIYIYQNPDTKAVEVKFPVSRTGATNETLQLGNNTTDVDEIDMDGRKLMLNAYAVDGNVEVRATMPADMTEARIELFDLLGNRVGSQVVAEGETEVFASFSVVPGVYIARAQARTSKGTVNATDKVIVR